MEEKSKLIWIPCAKCGERLKIPELESMLLSNTTLLCKGCIKKKEQMIIFFGVEDECWRIHIFQEETKFNQLCSNYETFYDKYYFFILDVTKLPVPSIGLFDRISPTDLQTTKALFLLHLCKSYLEEYKFEK